MTSKNLRRPINADIHRQLMNELPTFSCANCYFFEIDEALFLNPIRYMGEDGKLVTSIPQGWCHRYPPNRDEYSINKFPKTFPDNYCGEISLILDGGAS